MSLQGSIHKWSDGIGYGAFIPTERAYYNVRERRPSRATTREYRRHNVIAGIDTHRSDISFGKTNDSVRGGADGHSRAREATKSLTSGEVGGFCWPVERARTGNVETILASASSNASLPPAAAGPSSVRSRRSTSTPKLSARSVQQYEQAAQEQVIAGGGQEKKQQQQLGRCSSQEQAASAMSARCRTASSTSCGGASTQRSGATTTSASSRSHSIHSSRLSTSRLSSYGADSSDGNSSGRRSRCPVSYAGSNNDAGSTGQPTSRRSARENRLRPLSLGQGARQHRQEEERYPGGGASSSRALRLPSSDSPNNPKSPSFRAPLDPSFDRHHKYDLIAHDRAANGGEITGRFGPVRGSSVMAASLLTSELSTPWSHVLRGQHY